MVEGGASPARFTPKRRTWLDWPVLGPLTAYVLSVTQNNEIWWYTSIDTLLKGNSCYFVSVY